MARYGQAFKDKAVARLLPPAVMVILTACKEVSSVYYSVRIAEEFYDDYKIRHEKYSEYIHEDMLFLVSAKNCTHEEICMFSSVYSERFISDAGEIEKVEVFSDGQVLMTFFAEKISNEARR